MFVKDDIVTYGAQGVCRVVDITEKNFGGSAYQYYELQPVYDNRSTLFVPVGNAALTERMHKLLSADAMGELIRAVGSLKVSWIEDEAARKERYKELVAGGDRMALVRAVKALRIYRGRRQAAGKGLHSCDERFLKDAEKMLYDEVAFVLQIDRSQVAREVPL